ncbi:MAG TPA: hypothetical protein PLU72_02050 [Candidatus Ozemobacteraceae bacterium]|nr:hypothetical protein [Candidatus Ozemobacteraceae bacterium]HQG27027.1 hypothetical protein [Candidatus Ozemobacteraceae bacterium]
MTGTHSMYSLVVRDRRANTAAPGGNPFVLSLSKHENPRALRQAQGERLCFDTRNALA